MRPSFSTGALLLSLVAGFVVLVGNGGLAQEQVLRFNGGGADYARAITADATGAFYVGGASDSASTPVSFAVVKYNPADALQWVARYQGATNQIDGFVSALVVDAVGNVYAAGYIATPGPFLSYKIDWLVVSFDANGVHRWAHTFNSINDGFDQAAALALDPAGALYVTGVTGGGNDFDWLTIKYSLTGNLLWQRTEAGAPSGDNRPAALKLDAAGNLVVLGSMVDPAAGIDHDVMLVKYNPQGNALWTKTYTDTAISDESPAALTIDAAGNIYVTGGIQPFDPESGSIPFILKLDANGSQLFGVKGEGCGGSSVALGPDGNVVVSGTIVGDVGSFVHSAVSKFSPAGALIWSTRLDPTGDTPYNGRAEVAADGSIHFGGSRFVSTGHDFFAAKFSATGQEIWRRVNPDGQMAQAVHLA